MAPVPAEEPTDDPLSTLGSEPLVPILQVDDGQLDPMALATWQQALSNTVSVEVPHDLMGLWLYPSQGGVALLGPSELAADDLAIPIPSPYLTSEQLTTIEQTVTHAGYGSATCLPIRFGKRDVALLLVADLQPERYGPAQRVLLQCVAQRIGPMLGRIARQWVPEEGSFSRQQERIAGLLAAVSQANRESSAPQRFVAAIGRALAPLLPHDHIELLVPNQAGDQYFRLGEHAAGPLWTDPSLTISREHLDIAAIFESQTRLLVADTYEDARWPRGFLIASDSGGADIRGVIGAQLGFGGKSVAYLLVGSVGPEIYGADDVELLSLLAGLIAPQIAGFLRTEKPAAPLPAAPPPAALPRDGSAELVFRIAAMLATTSDPAVVTRLIAEEGSSLLPFTKLIFALKVTEGDRVILLEPGDQRAVTDHPQVPVTGTALARVLKGDAPNAFGEALGKTRLVVPLRVAGKVHGALLFSATPPAALAESHLGPAQRLADIVAAHLELVRLSTMLTPTSMPGSRRGDKVGPQNNRAHPAIPPLRQ